MICRDILYFFFLLISFPFWTRFVFKKKYREIIKLRFSPAQEPIQSKSIWIHAVSVGEVKSLSRLIGQLSARGSPLVLSVTTPSGYCQARETYPGIPVIPAPLDFSFTIKKFIRTINPGLLILNELEIWPNWLSLFHKKAIPTILINGRMSETAFRKYRRFRFLIQKSFRMIDFYFLQAEIHKKRFLALKIPESRMKVCGNIKADEASALLPSLPPKPEIFKQLKMKKNRKPLVTFASTHSSDEKIIFPALAELRQKFAILIVPRHPERCPKIQKRLDAFQVPHSVWSAAEAMDPDESVLIIDRIGYLFNIFSISDMVYLGGSFSPKIGGHNLYEPAIQGKIILGGPCFHNFPVIGEELVREKVYRVVNGSEELKNTLFQLDPNDLKKAQKAAMESVKTKQGSSQCILEYIRAITL